MNILRSTLLLSLLFIQLSLSAQVKGRVLSAPDAPIAYVNVLLVNAADSSLVKGTITDEGGRFAFDDIAAGNYRLRISFLGYRKTVTDAFTLSAKTYDAGNILLKPDSKTLGDVEIVAEKQFIERHVDRMVVNIDKSIVSSGTDALEIFKRLPGVSVDQGGTISLKNKTGVLILVNGRPSNLTSTDLAALLKSMKAEQIERIEIMVNPPAKYDAAGSAGVINIVLKKNQALGLNGSVHGGGMYSNEKIFPILAHTEDAGFQLNYRTAKWNLFCSYDYVSETSSQGHDVTSRFYSGNHLQSTLTTHQIQNGFSDQQYGKVGLDYELSPRQTIGFLANARNFHNVASNSLNHIVIADSVGHMTSGVDSYFNVYEPVDVDDANLYYTFKIDSTGREFSVNADYLRFYHPNEHSLYYYNFDANNQFLSPVQHIISRQTDNINIASVKADYTHTFGKTIKLDAGLKAAEVKSDNNGGYWNVIGGTSYPDASMTNHFIYTENINAAYLNYSQEINSKLSVQAGLRGEQSLVKGDLITRDTSFSHTYMDLFPSLFLNWKANDKNTFNLSASKRIDRPDYDAVNPFLYTRGPYEYHSGNPGLRPQYTNGIELTHVYKGMLNTTLGYSRTSDVITWVSRQDNNTHTTYISLANLNTLINYSFNTSLSVPITKWWTSTNSISVYYKDYEGAFLNGQVSQAMLSGELNTQNTIQLSKRWSAEVSVVYLSKQSNGINIIDPLCFADAGIQWKFAGERGTIRLNGSNLLWAKMKARTQYQNQDFTTVNYDSSRSIHVGLTWKFGSSTTTYRNKSRGGSEELNRLKG